MIYPLFPNKFQYPLNYEYISLRSFPSQMCCAILTVLKEESAIAMIEMPIPMNHFGQPGIKIFVVYVRALMMSWKSSRLDSIIIRLTSVSDLVMALKGSLCSASNCK